MVRLKFRCVQKAYRQHWDARWDRLGSVELVPVSGDGSDDNAAFYEATPAGKIEFATINEAALAEFEPGDEYYITLEKIPSTAAPTAPVANEAPAS